MLYEVITKWQNKKASRKFGKLFYFVSTQTKFWLASCFAWYCKFFSTFCSACSKYFAAIFCCHTFAETMFVSTFAIRWLKCHFHRYLFLNYYSFLYRLAKVEIKIDTFKNKHYFIQTNMNFFQKQILGGFWMNQLRCNEHHRYKKGKDRNNFV